MALPVSFGRLVHEDALDGKHACAPKRPLSGCSPTWSASTSVGREVVVTDRKGLDLVG